MLPTPSVGWTSSGAFAGYHLRQTALLFSWIQNTGSQLIIYLYVKMLANTENVDGSRITYPIDVKSAGFRSRLEVPQGSRHTDEFWYNSSLFVEVYIYIYIGEYVCYYLTWWVCGRPNAV